MTMPPSPRSTSRTSVPPQYASQSDASPSSSSTQLPGITSFAFDDRRGPYDRRGEASYNEYAQRPCNDPPPYAYNGQANVMTYPPSAASGRDTRLDELRTAPSAPPPMLTGLPQHSTDNKRYELIIRQQPRQGRLCGLGSKDKRPLDPLPILQLKIFNPDGTQDEDAENSSNLTLQVSLRKHDPVTGAHSGSVLVESNDPVYPLTKMLEGRTVANGNIARDLDGSRACFFVFTDLSIRQEGRFRLDFKLLAINPMNLPTAGGAPSHIAGHVVAEQLSEPFDVYSPRRFPGMSESTELAKCLARQGIQVPVRNDVRRRQDQAQDADDQEQVE